MKITFEQPKGVEYTLTKHPAVLAALKHEKMLPAEAKTKAWYFRPAWSRNHPFKLSADDADAIRAAKDLIKGRTEQPGDFVAFIEARDARRGVTIGAIATKWLDAGLPFSKTEPREAAAAAALKDTLTRALPWWTDKRVAAITKPVHDDYVVYRRTHNKRAATSPTAGSRAADLELGALSCLCQWAVREGTIDTNPFDDRQRYHATAAVNHCHQFAPESDEEFHRILAWFFTRQYVQADLGNRHRAGHLALCSKLAGGWLAFTALTGLRPEEPAFLYRGETLQQAPPKPAALPPGTIFPDRTGNLKMKVVRSKHGQNPYVLLHPVALDFLTTWGAWLDAQPEFNQITTGRHLFPSLTDATKSFCPVTTKHGVPDVDTTLLNKRLAQCCADLKLDARKPKGVGRAFYVAVRRSQGEDDPTIAGELGQTTNGALVRSTYGDPDAMHGGGLLDWVAQTVNPQTKLATPLPHAWATLKPVAQANVVNVAFK